MSRFRKRLVAVLAVAALVVIAGWWLFVRGDVIRVPDELPPNFPAQGFDHAPFKRLLERFVADGRVRYGAWHDDADASRDLDRYLAAVARYSPDSAPARFPTDDDKLAFWLNAYNACVLKGVLAHWPITSVHDVTGPIEPKAGFGFFWRMRFVIGGAEINLYDLEHTVIRKRFDEPRVHFVLNCASKGCPPLRRDVPTGDALEAHLQATMLAILLLEARVDHEKKTVRVSALFDWYGEDFRPTPLAWLRQQGVRAGEDYTLVFAPWDWALNGS